MRNLRCRIKVICWTAKVKLRKAEKGNFFMVCWFLSHLVSPNSGHVELPLWPRERGWKQRRRKSIWTMLTCLNFAMASDVMKSPFWNFVTKHITWYWLWPRSSSPSTRAFNTWASCRWVGDDCRREAEEEKQRKSCWWEKMALDGGVDVAKSFGSSGALRGLALMLPLGAVNKVCASRNQVAITLREINCRRESFLLTCWRKMMNELN